MHTSLLRKCVAYGIVVGAILLIISCSQDEKAEQEETSRVDSAIISDIPAPVDTIDYGEWKTYEYQNIRINYPENHPHADLIGDMAKVYLGALRADCRMLGLNVPTDTIVVYYYVGPGHGRLLTGQRYPYFVGDTLHHWTPNPLGCALMKYLIPKWQPQEPRHTFLKHGLIALLDNSGNNYHERTLECVETGIFIPLAQLAVDSSVNSDMERYESSMAASLVDFLVFYYGIDKFGALYQSQHEFDRATNEVLGVSTDSLQTMWLNAIEKAVVQLKQQNPNQ
jgi:hypothetical protein